MEARIAAETHLGRCLRAGPLAQERTSRNKPHGVRRPSGAHRALRRGPQPHDSRTGPDSPVFGVETADGTVTELASLDGRYLSTEVAEGFTGRVVGVYAASGTVHVDWFDYAPLPR